MNGGEMLVRVVRAVIGTGLLLLGLPLLLAGAALWFAIQHQDPAGGYSAPLTTISTEGHAVVASDVDALLRREAPFTRSGQTTLRLTAHTGTGPAFIGLAPASDVARYLAGVRYARVDEVRLARGPLPVVTVPVEGDRAPEGVPHEQPFWQTSSRAGTLEWSPYELRGERLALVVMDPAGQAPLTVDLTARVHPQWLASSTLGLLVLGTVLLLVAIVALAWPSRPREIVYVVPPAQVPEIAAQLGVPVPAARTGQAAPTGEEATDPLAVGADEPAWPPAAPEPAPAAPPAGSPPPPPQAGSAPPAGPEASPSQPAAVRRSGGHQPPDPPPPQAPDPRQAPPVLEWPPPATREVTAPPLPSQDHHNCQEAAVTASADAPTSR